MQEYTVTWTIQLTADNAQEAAKQAKEMMLDGQSAANVFSVLDENDQEEIVDLDTLIDA